MTAMFLSVQNGKRKLCKGPSKVFLLPLVLLDLRFQEEDEVSYGHHVITKAYMVFDQLRKKLETKEHIVNYNNTGYGIMS